MAQTANKIEKYTLSFNGKAWQLEDNNGTVSEFRFTTDEEGPVFEISLPWIGDGPIGVENVRDIVPVLERCDFEVEVIEPEFESDDDNEEVHTTAIFFDDLKETAQHRIIETELLTQGYEDITVKAIEIDPDLYGYDPDPKKQGLEQRLTVTIDVDGDTERWLMTWDCMASEFTTLMKD